MSQLDTPFAHRPVMVDEVVAFLAAVPTVADGLIVDGTVGGGGHAAAILDARPDLGLLGVDRDDAALDAARHSLARFGARVRLVQDRFDHFARHVGDQPVVGVLLDLGVSSPQFDRSDRGFSYRMDAPLDMRMDRRQMLTAALVINSYDEATLVRLFLESGERKFARRIASRIVAARPLETTIELADVVRSAIPAAVRRTGGHPAKKVFQALRIEVNGELDVLGPAIDSALDVLIGGGRCVILSYHSGEDKLVKQRFLDAFTGGCICPPALPCVCGAVSRVKLLTRGARMPSAAEVVANPRAESARLRSVEKLPTAAEDQS